MTPHRTLSALLTGWVLGALCGLTGAEPLKQRANGLDAERLSARSTCGHRRRQWHRKCAHLRTSVASDPPTRLGKFAFFDWLRSSNGPQNCDSSP